MKFVLFAHVTDSSGSEDAAYLYLNLSSSGSVTSYFGARNDDYDHASTISLSDYTVVSSNYGLGTSSPCSNSNGYSAQADLNADNCGDISDTTIASATYGFPAYR
jgi:hypothetical protein